MQKQTQSKLRKSLIVPLVILGLGFSNIVRAETSTCDDLLNECATVVGKQELTIRKQEETILEQDKLIKIEEQEVERLDSELKVTKGIAWGELGVILLLIFL